MNEAQIHVSFIRRSLVDCNAECSGPSHRCDQNSMYKSGLNFANEFFGLTTVGKQYNSLEFHRRNILCIRIKLKTEQTMCYCGFPMQ